MIKQWNQAGLFSETDTREQKNRSVLTAIFREAITDEKRLSLAGVGLVKWFAMLSKSLVLPDCLFQKPWGLTENQSRDIVAFLLDEMRSQRAMSLPDCEGAPIWDSVSSWPPQAYAIGPRRKTWCKTMGCFPASQSAIIKHFLSRLLDSSGMSESESIAAAGKLMEDIWDSLMDFADEPLLLLTKKNGAFRLNSRWLRTNLVDFKEI